MNLTVVERKTRLIGAIMVERGLLTPAQLRAALEVQAERGGLLGEIVMAEFGVTRAQVSQVIAEQLSELESETGSEASAARPLPQLRAVGASQDGEAHLPVGDALLELGLVSRDQIEAAHEVQRETGERLGEILVGQGVISRLELADALSEHWSSLTKLRAPGVVDAPLEAGTPAQLSAADLGALAGVVEGVGARLEESIADRDRALRGELERLSARFDELAVLHEQAGARLEAIASAQEAGTAQGSAVELEELPGQLERLSSRFDEVAALHVQTAARLDAIAAAQEAGASRGSPAEFEGLTGQFERLSSRLDELVGGRDQELVSRFEGLSSRFDEVAVLHEQTGARLDAIAAAQEAVAGRGSPAEFEALARVVEGVGAGLEASVAERDRELTGQFERLSARLDELAGGRDELRGQFERLSSRFDEVAGGRDRALKGQFERLSARLDELAGGRDELRGQFERLSSRFDEVAGGRDRALKGQFERLSSRFDEMAVLHEQTGARLDAIAAAQEAVAGRGSPAEFEALAGVVEGVGAGLEASVAERDRELTGQFERLSARLDEVVDGRDGELVSRFEGLSSRFDELAALHEQTGSRFEASAAGRNRELTGLFERLSAQVDELVAAGQAEELVERIASLVEAQGLGEEVLGRLVSEVAALHAQNEVILEASSHRSAATPKLLPDPPHGSYKKTKKQKSKKK